MNRHLLLAFAAAVALSSCKKSAETAVDPVPVKETVANVGLIDFQPSKGAFMCRAPGEWKVREDASSGNDSITFLGPLSDSRLASISILQYPSNSDKWSDARKYAESFWEVTPDNKQPEVTKKIIDGKEVLFFHFEKPFRKVHSKKVEYMQRCDYALIPVKGGFFELWHTAPADRYQETLPVFEAVVKSFKPKS